MWRVCGKFADAPRVERPGSFGTRNPSVRSKRKGKAEQGPLSRNAREVDLSTEVGGPPIDVGQAVSPWGGVRIEATAVVVDLENNPVAVPDQRQPARLSIRVPADVRQRLPRDLKDVVGAGGKLRGPPFVDRHCGPTPERCSNSAASAWSASSSWRSARIPGRSPKM